MTQNQTLPRIGGAMSAPKYRALQAAVAAGVELPEATLAKLAELARLVRHCETATLTTPTIGALADTLASGGNVSLTDVSKAAAAATWAQVQHRAIQDATHDLEQAAIDAAPVVLEELQSTVIEPAIEVMGEVDELGEFTPGQLFDAGRDEDAARLRAAATAHQQIVKAVELGVKLGATITTRTVRDFGTVLATIADGEGPDLLGVHEVAEVHVNQSGPSVTINGRKAMTSNVQGR